MSINIVVVTQDVEAIVVAVEKLLTDVGVVESVKEGKYTANGVILQELLQVLETVATNPVVQALIESLISGLLKPTPTPTPAT